MATILMLLLGFALLTPTGTANSQSTGYTIIVRELQALAEQGDAEAQFNLGLVYSSIAAGPEDEAEAKKLILEAAKQGHAGAQEYLGHMYLHGSGLVPQDYVEAAKWLHKVAEKGNIGAQRLLGSIYAHAMGVPKDAVKGYAWFSIVADQGIEGAEELQQLVAESLDPEELARAQELALQYWETYVLPFKK